MSEKISPFQQKDSFEALNMHVDRLIDKGVRCINEDAVLLSDSRFAVFDGASSVVPYADAEGKTGGYLAAHIARDAFAQPHVSLKEAALEANGKIGEAMAAAGIDASKKESAWCTGFAAVDIDIAKKEFAWAQIADALILRINKDGTHQMLIQDDYDHDRAIMSLWKEKADRREENIRAKLDEDILALRRTANVAYGVLNGDPNAARFLRTGRESLEHVGHLLLFTDGLLIPKRNPEAPDDFSTFTTLFLEGGLARVREYVRELENADPNCWEYPRYKKSDDIAAVAIRFD